MPETVVPMFSQADAQMLLDLAQAAPLQNLAHARAAEAVVHRFVRFYDALTQRQTEPKPELPAVPAGTFADARPAAQMPVVDLPMLPEVDREAARAACADHDIADLPLAVEAEKAA